MVDLFRVLFPTAVIAAIFAAYVVELVRLRKARLKPNARDHGPDFEKDATPAAPDLDGKGAAGTTSARHLELVAPRSDS